MLPTICGSGMTLRLIRPICPFNCFLFRVDSLYHLRLNGGILQIICSLTNHISGFDFISTLAVAFFFLDYQPMTERHVCLAAIVKEGGKKKSVWSCSKSFDTDALSSCREWTTLFFVERTRLGTIVSLSRGGYILLVYTCTQSWKFN